MKKMIIVGCALLAFAGCASIKQAKDDIKTGYTAPVAVGEVTPLEAAQPIAQAATGALTTAIPITAPFSMPIQGAIASAVGLFFAWQRGRAIRKNQPISANPVTGFLGNQMGLESVLQSLATVTSGITEVFREGSSAQHVWQGVLTGLLGLGGTMLAIPAVHAAVIANPTIALLVGGLSGLANGIQQSLTKILPVQSPASSNAGSPTSVASPA